mmetsp:Transcript_38456/g.72117  ORF Transcript_38456/g.72117 Transcript_38456/m.72117 type:complete len:91 (-) Transcript_38456:168-440(-)
MRGGYGRRSMYDDVEVDDVDDFKHGTGYQAHMEPQGSYNYRGGYGYGRMRRGNSWSNGVRGGYYGRRGDRGDSWYSGRRGAERLYDGLDD